jgi:hypothetical protein
MYELFHEVAQEYGDQLQLIVVDTDLPAEVRGELSKSIPIVRTLSQSDRLIRIPADGGDREPETEPASREVLPHLVVHTGEVGLARSLHTPARGPLAALLLAGVTAQLRET